MTHQHQHQHTHANTHTLHTNTHNAQTHKRTTQNTQGVIASSAYQNLPTYSNHLTPEVQQRNPWILQIFSLRTDREQHVPDSSNHSLYLIKLFSFSNLEGSSGGNQQPDGSISLSPSRPPSLSHHNNTQRQRHRDRLEPKRPRVNGDERNSRPTKCSHATSEVWEKRHSEDLGRQEHGRGRHLCISTSICLQKRPDVVKVLEDNPLCPSK